MADEAAVLDAPVLDTVDEVVEQPTEEAVVEAPVEDKPEIKGDDRVIPKWLRNMKESDPEGYREAREKFFTLRDIDKKLEGFDLDGTKKFIEENGSPEAILQTLQEREAKAQELDQINQAIESGDTAILEKIPAESLAKLAPAVAEKWAQADPDGWARSMSGVMAATIAQSGIPMFLERMGMLLEFGKTEEVQNALKQLQSWAVSFQQKAAAPVNTPTQTKGPDVNAERQQWEQEKFQTSLKDEVETIRSQEITKALSEYVSRKPNDADAKELAISNVRNEVIQRLAKDTDFQNKLNSLVARKDKDGAMRLIKARESKAIEEIAPRIGRTIFGQPSPVVQKQPVTQKAMPKAVQKPADKFEQIWSA